MNGGPRAGRGRAARLGFAAAVVLGAGYALAGDEAATAAAGAGTAARFVEFDLPTTRPIHTPHVVVWLPADYDAGRQQYAVVYMHDGQNLFFVDRSNFHKVWAADRAAARLIAQGRVQPFLIVGIDQPGTDRPRQYLPAPLLADVSPRTRAALDRFMGGANLSDDYLAFIVEELKPRIDREFRTLPDPAHTAIVGSSMGGLISLYGIARYPQVFGLAGCLSTHWPLGDPRDLGEANSDVIATWGVFIRERLGAPRGRRIWFDHGTETLDTHYPPYQRAIDADLAANGWRPGRDFVSRVYPGAAHEENAWAERLTDVFAWLLAREP